MRLLRLPMQKAWLTPTLRDEHYPGLVFDVSYAVVDKEHGVLRPAHDSKSFKIWEYVDSTPILHHAFEACAVEMNKRACYMQ